MSKPTNKISGIATLVTEPKDVSNDRVDVVNFVAFLGQDLSLQFSAYDTVADPAFSLNKGDSIYFEGEVASKVFNQENNEKRFFTFIKLTRFQRVN